MEYLPLHLEKMRVHATEGTAYYTLETGDGALACNDLIGRRIAVEHEGRIECIACGRVTAKSYSQGYCYPCSQRLPQCDLCIVSPDRCHFGAGTCRDPTWGREHCGQEHFVYLANTAGLKVGITRARQATVRWLDQGAIQALPILRTQTRHQAGLAEVMLRAHVTDRTDWRRLLRGASAPLDLRRERSRLLSLVEPELEGLRARFGAAAVIDAEPVEFRCDYPVSEYPAAVKALTLDRTARVEGVLLGIKGQYLMLDTGVFNVRRHTGYRVKVGW